jgi:hypothetical protein
MDNDSHVTSRKSLNNEHFNRDNSLLKSKNSALNAEGGDYIKTDQDPPLDIKANIHEQKIIIN